MRYLEFILGMPVTIAVAERVSPQQVAERLKLEVRSHFWPFHFEKVVGWVKGESLSIEWRGGLIGTNFAPRLKGRLISTGGATKFVGRYGAPTFLRFFLGFWVCFDAIFAIMTHNVEWQGSDMPPWFIWPFLAVHLLAPFAITALGLIGADKIRQRLTQFLVDVGSGRPNPNA